MRRASHTRGALCSRVALLPQAVGLTCPSAREKVQRAHAKDDPSFVGVAGHPKACAAAVSAAAPKWLGASGGLLPLEAKGFCFAGSSHFARSRL